MGANLISGPVTFDGTTLVAGDLKLVVERCEVDGVDFSFSPKYGLLLLKDKTRPQAQKLLKELAEFGCLSEESKKYLLQQVCISGFKTGQLELERYKEFVPTDEPRFYAEVFDDGQLNTHYISLVSAKKTLRFGVFADTQAVLSQLPRNVYKSESVRGWFNLTLEQYHYLLGKEKDFFDFAEELYRYTGSLRGNTCDNCYRRYFENTAQAHELLGVIRSNVSARESRDKLFDTLQSDKILEFSEGLFVYSGWYTLYVSKDGDVQRLCYSKPVEMREAVLRAYQTGKLPTKLEEEKDDHTLKLVAEIVGKVKPELALVILP